MSPFEPKLSILPPPQRRLWDELAALPAHFVLYGGTALALHFGHGRLVTAVRNVDLDRLPWVVPKQHPEAEFDP
jgi:hypothetical protein